MEHTSLNMDQFLTDDGSVDYGKLMRFYRKDVMQWKSAQILADVYNEVMGEKETITIRWIQRMEKDNKVPTDNMRRWVLATLLNIPPAYSGLAALQPIFQAQDTLKLPLPTKMPALDLTSYTARLKTLWPSWFFHYTQHPHAFMDEMIGRIHLLEHNLLYGNSAQKEQVALLLCNYLVLFGNIRRDQGDLHSAKNYLDQAVALTKEKNYQELCAKALYLRGYVFFDLWGIRQDRTDRMGLLHAVNDFYDAQTQVYEAKAHKKPVSQPLQSAILAESGLAHAYMALDEKDRKHALKLIDTSGDVVRSRSFQRDPSFLHVNEEWSIIDKAEAYIAIQWPRSALNELANINPGPNLRQRYIYADILEAEANIACGRVEMGVVCAEDALAVVEKNRSATFLARISNMYGDLKQQRKYSQSPDVARLGVKLLKVQHPELFV